ncbi:sulfotransferase family protein [Streptomonospora wellingtoniae]|uniref:Sulfotransferase n=1 Tax=Streptomonospora wellingtoniae TaxID=3075544 RepID=A0ABU2KNZ9_9ACTN|nr:sulfotransferase [Streptomonospora sp. DSM 45055]MDT0300863.1 sulfotransferase [Streptomonospora sp. DSM 45055]
MQLLKVIGAGLPRTGTSSLKSALERLGFGPCHHMFEVMSHPEHIERWMPALEGGSADWDHVFEGYRAAVDFPAAIFWRELSRTYPDAKVILTVRDPRRWHESVRDAFPDRSAIDAGSLPGPLQGFSDFLPALTGAAEERLGLDWTPGRPLTEDEAVDVFNTHTEQVRAAAPADRLLVFSARDGWGPLCDFLGADVPDEPFPHLNETETMQRMFAALEESGTVASPFDA